MCSLLIKKTTALAILILLSVPLSEGKNQTLIWSYGTVPIGKSKVDILQCQSLTFNWSGDKHSVYEFPDEESYTECDFSNAKKLAATSDFGEFSLQGNDTLGVTKRWFGSEFGNDCYEGNMKTALKIRPLFRKKYQGFECAGGTRDVVKSEPTLKKCRKRCKRRRGCFAIQYDSPAEECTVYSGAPSGPGNVDSDVSCEVASTSCFLDEPSIQLGKRMDNQRALAFCYDSNGVLITNKAGTGWPSLQWKGPLKEAKQRCLTEPDCHYLVSWGCLGNNWKYCSEIGFGNEGTNTCAYEVMNHTATDPSASRPPTALPTDAPTQSPTSNCTLCSDEPNSYMIKNNKTCATWTFAHTKKCNLDEDWQMIKTCQFSCYDNDNGYKGDICC